MTVDNQTKPTKVDWSTPYDEWLIPLLNRFRHSGGIECRAIPSAIQAHIDDLLAQAEARGGLAELKAYDEQPTYEDGDKYVRARMAELEASLKERKPE